MIKKERLQELIEQNAIVYQLLCGVIYEYKLNKNYLVGVADGKISLMKICNEYEQDLVDYARNLFETKAEAEWHAEFGRIERTERLELPTWEEFDKSEKLVRFIGKNGGKCKLEGYFNLDLQSGFIDVVENGSSQLSLSEYTKENYTLACRKCKELFLGENE